MVSRPARGSWRRHARDAPGLTRGSARKSEERVDMMRGPDSLIQGFKRELMSFEFVGFELKPAQAAR